MIVVGHRTGLFEALTKDASRCSTAVSVTGQVLFVDGALSAGI